MLPWLIVVALTAQGNVDINPEICGAKLHTHTETPVSSCPVRMPSITDITSTFLATHASVPSVLSFQANVHQFLLLQSGLRCHLVQLI